jgi:hypothetical protein
MDNLQITPKLAKGGPHPIRNNPALILPQMNRPISAAHLQQRTAAVQFASQGVIVFIFFGQRRKVGVDAAISGVGVQVGRETFRQTELNAAIARVQVPGACHL